MAASYPFKVSNKLGYTVTVYDTFSNTPPTDPPSTNSQDYTPVYTKLGSVEAGKEASLNTQYPLARIVVARESDDFPVKLGIVQQLDPSSTTVTATSSDEATSQKVWVFYQQTSAQPYTPSALNFQSIIINTADLSKLNGAVADYFNANGIPGADMGGYTMVSYWATNSLNAIPGSYYCYEPSSSSSGGFILPTEVSGMLDIANGTASFTPTGGTAVALTFAQTQLSSSGASGTTGVSLTAITRDLIWEGKTADDIVTCMTGTYNGKQMIAQPYKDPSLPWYAITYDLVYGAYTAVQYYMMIDMAIHVLSSIPGAISKLGEGISKFASSVKDFANNTGKSANPDSAVGDDVDPINVDIDVDVDVDIDVDIDIDIDVDVDVDIDIDVDVDFGVVVDVDVDVDIDVDIDVVTDTDIDVDIDVDIDTDVDVQPGAISSALNKLGGWIMGKVAPALLELTAIQFAFMSASALLQAWKSGDEKDIAALQPAQSTGLGLLLNYMLQDDKKVSMRWTTFSNFAQQSQDDNTHLQIVLSTLVQAKNDKADAAAKAWRWTTDEQNAVVTAMSKYTGDDSYKAFQVLASTTIKGKDIPVKVGAATAQKYLKKTA